MNFEDCILGILTFLVTLKFLRLIRYNKHVAVFSGALNEGIKLFFSFMLVFFISFEHFMYVGILIFKKGTKKKKKKKKNYLFPRKP